MCVCVCECVCVCVCVCQVTPGMMQLRRRHANIIHVLLSTSSQPPSLQLHIIDVSVLLVLLWLTCCATLGSFFPLSDPVWPPAGTHQT